MECADAGDFSGIRCRFDFRSCIGDDGRIGSRSYSGWQRGLGPGVRFVLHGEMT